nr:zinc finger BED domain-containing protein RICESLEEPER 2-like [Ipomoea batatas]
MVDCIPDFPLFLLQPSMLVFCSSPPWDQWRSPKLRRLQLVLFPLDSNNKQCVTRPTPSRLVSSRFTTAASRDVGQWRRRDRRARRPVQTATTGGRRPAPSVADPVHMRRAAKFRRRLPCFSRLQLRQSSVPPFQRLFRRLHGSDGLTALRHYGRQKISNEQTQEHDIREFEMNEEINYVDLNEVNDGGVNVDNLDVNDDGEQNENVDVGDEKGDDERNVKIMIIKANFKGRKERGYLKLTLILVKLLQRMEV